MYKKVVCKVKDTFIIRSIDFAVFITGMGICFCAVIQQLNLELHNGKYINYTHPKWKLNTVYNGIYYAWEKTPVPPNAGDEIQSFEGMLKLLSVWQ